MPDQDGGDTLQLAGLVGRAAEFHALVSGFAAAVDGSAGLVQLQGSFGTGKTALLDVFQSHAESAGAWVVRTSCAPESGDYSAVLSYSAVLGLFGREKFAEDSGSLPLSHRLYRHVVEMTRSGPLVLMLDDAQWCDERSAHWLDFLLRKGFQLPMLIVLAQRPTETARWQQRTIELGVLPDEQVYEFARRWWDKEPDGSFVHACVAATKGNPSLLEKLLTRLRAEGLSPDGEGALRTEELEAELLSGLLAAKLKLLPDHVGKVVAAVAVLGRTDPELVGMLSGVLSG